MTHVSSCFRFNHENIEDANEVPGGYLSDVNHNSLTVINRAVMDKSIAGSKEYDRFQFERVGYFCVDKDSSGEKVGELFIYCQAVLRLYLSIYFSSYSIESFR